MQREWKPIKKYEDILFEQYGRIAKITITRPRVYNAFRPQTNKEMLDAMAYCRDASDIGVIILLYHPRRYRHFYCPRGE